MCLCLPLSLCLCSYLYLSLSLLNLYPCVIKYYLILSLSLSLCLSVSVSLSLSVPVSLSLCLSVFLSVSVSVFVCLSVDLSVYLSVSLQTQKVSKWQPLNIMSSFVPWSKGAIFSISLLDFCFSVFMLMEWHRLTRTFDMGARGGGWGEMKRDNSLRIWIYLSETNPDQKCYSSTKGPCNKKPKKPLISRVWINCCSCMPCVWDISFKDTRREGNTWLSLKEICFETYHQCNV